jgi:hypothetical protein
VYLERRVTSGWMGRRVENILKVRMTKLLSRKGNGGEQKGEVVRRRRKRKKLG